jgi:hypothetical protein
LEGENVAGQNFFNVRHQLLLFTAELERSNHFKQLKWGLNVKAPEETYWGIENVLK